MFIYSQTFIIFTNIFRSSFIFLFLQFFVFVFYNEIDEVGYEMEVILVRQSVLSFKLWVGKVKIVLINNYRWIYCNLPLFFLEVIRKRLELSEKQKIG